MNDILNILIAKELEHLGIKDFIVEDCIEKFDTNSFTLRKETGEILFIYSQNYQTGGYYAGDIDVELLSEPEKATFDYSMMENNFIKTVFKAKSNVDVKITCDVTVTSIFRYIKIKPTKTTEK